MLKLCNSKWRVVGALLLGLSVSVQAAELSPLLQIAPTSTLQTPTTLTAPITVTAIPQVTGFQPSGCVGKGATVTIQGKNFGLQTGKAVALGGSGIHVDLAVSSWSASSIAAAIPNDTKIQAGQWYYIGVEKTGHAGWLSNIDKTVTICTTATLAPVVIAPSSTSTLSLAPRAPLPTPGGSASAPASADSSPATPTPSASEPDVAASSDYSDPGYSGGSAPPTPLRTPSGSLLQAQLPAPPQNVPPPAKRDTTVEPGEVIVVSANLDEAQALAEQARTLGLGIKRRTTLRGLGFVVTVLRVPKEASVGDAVGLLRQNLPQVWVDANHRYELMAGETKFQATELMGWSTTPACGSGIAIGMLDSAVETDHPALRDRDVIVRSFLASGVQMPPPVHGTATAALLVGQGEVNGLLPGAKLYVGSVFRQRSRKDVDTTADSIVQALDWLATERVAVVNLSLGGPRNLIVEAAIQRILAMGIAVVAAAGNGGPDAPPVYPAAQDGVIAVTAVDIKLNPYRRANRGDYVGFAALGVDVLTAAPGGGTVYVSGTSYAAPFVSAAVAIARPNKRGAGAAQRQLRDAARDLGDPGKDAVFGWGLVRAPGCGKKIARD
jgi:hypothetical protein